MTGYHVFNLAVHLACGLLLFGVIRRTLLTPRMRAAFGAIAAATAFIPALLRVVHRLNAESVTYVPSSACSSPAPAGSGPGICVPQA